MKPTKTKQFAQLKGLIGVDVLSTLVKTVIWSGRVRDEQPVSAVLIAEQESAKTEMLKQFEGTNTLEFFSDLTSRGLTAYKGDIESGKIRHIVILDLIRVLAHPRVTADRTIQTIAGLVEEGQCNIADAGGVERWATENKKMPRIGALMAVTPQVHRKKRKMFRETGFMSRFLPVTFAYSDETVRAIHYAIQTGVRKPEPTPISIPKESLAATIPGSIAVVVKELAYTMGKKTGTYGFRWHRNLRCLIKARAISQKRFVVSTQDFEDISKWTAFFDDKGVTI